MTREEAKEIFLNRGFIDGVFDGNKWRDACLVISKWLEQEPKKGHWIEHEKSISTAFQHLRECSCCKCYFDWMMPRNSYCPNCGADMREVEK